MMKFRRLGTALIVFALGGIAQANAQVAPGSVNQTLPGTAAVAVAVTSSCDAENAAITAAQALVAKLQADIAANAALLAKARVALAQAEQLVTTTRAALGDCKTQFPPISINGVLWNTAAFDTCIVIRSQNLNAAAAARDAARTVVNNLAAVGRQLNQALANAQASLLAAQIAFAMCVDPGGYETLCETALADMEACVARDECSPEIYAIELNNCFAGEPSDEVAKKLLNPKIR